MKKIVVLFWGKAGNVERAARKVYAMFDADVTDIFDVDSFDVNTIENYELIIWGGSTIGAESWLDTKANNEWNRFFRNIENFDLSGKFIAFFGLGDQVLYPEHFVDGLGVFNEEAEKVNGKIIGQWPADGYKFSDSDGIADGLFYGLALDLDNQDDLTDERIKKWTDRLKAASGF
ncbi:MAG: flavodoxin [Bacteroidales bacterium]|nr:flavodoxin [Bacteroidales bacterium]